MSETNPSEELLKYGQPLSASYFQVNEGRLVADGVEVSCAFEAMFTDTGNIYVACRFNDFDSLDRLFSVPHKGGGFSPKQTYTKLEFIEGMDERAKVQVTVREGIERFASMGLDEPAIFEANEMVVSKTAEAIFAEDGSIAPFADIFTCTNIDSDILADFKIGDERRIHLGTLNDFSDTPFPPRSPFAKLFVGHDSWFLDWKSDDIAQLWCALVSLAIGKDVRWIAKTTFNGEKQIVEKQYVRQQNLKMTWAMFPVIQTANFDGLGAAKPFIEAAYAKVLSGAISREAASNYVESISHFVEYSLLTRSMHDQARLISTAIEELLAKWEQHTNAVGLAVVSKDEGDTLYGLIEENIAATIRSQNIAPERIGKIMERIGSFFKGDFHRATLRDRLTLLLQSDMSHSQFFETIIAPKLSPFIKTRNSIVHDGKFPAETKSSGDHDVWPEYYSMWMMLPFMTFVIFGYAGSFIDHYSTYLERRASKQGQT